MSRLPFYSTCVSWPAIDVHAPGGLCDMNDAAISITRRTFLKHVDKAAVRQLENALGYDRYLSMARDCYVSYHRSKLHGQRVYFFRHSAIEHVFHKEQP